VCVCERERERERTKILWPFSVQISGENQNYFKLPALQE